MELLWISWITGLVGSLHCAGMCGPIAFSLPVHPSTRIADFYTGRILYNLGRIVSYAMLGALTGAFGTALGFAGFQQELGIISGSLLVCMVILGRLNKAGQWGLLNRWNGLIRRTFSRLYAGEKWASLFLFGIINGLLPCGLVYTALAIALSTGSPMNGAIVMALFGLGTFPMMFVLSSSRRFISVNVWKGFARFSPLFALVIGVVFILRGLNLGIPYLSPKVEQQSGQVECCSDAEHHH